MIYVFLSFKEFSVIIKIINSYHLSIKKNTLSHLECYNSSKCRINLLHKETPGFGDMAAVECFQLSQRS